GLAPSSCRLPLKGGVMHMIRFSCPRLRNGLPPPSLVCARTALYLRGIPAFAGMTEKKRNDRKKKWEWRIFAVPEGSFSDGSGFSGFLHGLLRRNDGKKKRNDGKQHINGRSSRIVRYSFNRSIPCRGFLRPVWLQYVVNP
ncbi:MAG: hypothetical protein OXU61_00635, partial [Gammaproteobacteria bacterium]|nr:hypothetical protein [Gammaproteobacteria bacterium]